MWARGEEHRSGERCQRDVVAPGSMVYDGQAMAVAKTLFPLHKVLKCTSLAAVDRQWEQANSSRLSRYRLDSRSRDRRFGRAIWIASAVLSTACSLAFFLVLLPGTPLLDFDAATLAFYIIGFVFLAVVGCPLVLMLLFLGGALLELSTAKSNPTRRPEEELRAERDRLRERTRGLITNIFFNWVQSRPEQFLKHGSGIGCHSRYLWAVSRNRVLLATIEDDTFYCLDRHTLRAVQLNTDSRPVQVGTPKADVAAGAIVGGLLAGTVGAVVGSQIGAAGAASTLSIPEMSIDIYTNDIIRPVITLQFGDSIESAKRWYAWLQLARSGDSVD